MTLLCVLCYFFKEGRNCIAAIIVLKIGVKGEREPLTPGKTRNAQIRFLVNTIQNSELTTCYPTLFDSHFEPTKSFTGPILQ